MDDLTEDGDRLFIAAVLDARSLASGVRLQVPLVAHDRIFGSVKDLEPLTKLGD